MEGADIEEESIFLIRGGGSRGTQLQVGVALRRGFAVGDSGKFLEKKEVKIFFFVSKAILTVLLIDSSLFYVKKTNRVIKFSGEMSPLIHHHLLRVLTNTADYFSKPPTELFSLPPSNYMSL